METAERDLGLWRFNRGAGIGGKEQGRGGWLIVPADGTDRVGWSTRDDESLGGFLALVFVPLVLAVSLLV